MFDSFKSSKPFGEDIFMGKLLKWIVLTDQTFSTVDNDEFEDLLGYLKKDIFIKSRKTLMNRLQELFDLKQASLKKLLESTKSKVSITCDLWTSGNSYAMTFWKSNRYTYPILSAMARDFLAIQASSVPSERAFSAGANLVSKKRCSMTGTTIEMTQFLKYFFRDNK
jgi:hypothetical protein